MNYSFQSSSVAKSTSKNQSKSTNIPISSELTILPYNMSPLTALYIINSQVNLKIKMIYIIILHQH